MPAFVIGLIVAALAVIAVALADLRRREVRHLPKWAWALIIVLSVPAGAIVYAIIGRVSPHEAIVPPGS